MSAILLLDTSGSMVRKLAMASMVVREFLMASNPEDEFSLIQFNDDLRGLFAVRRETGGGLEFAGAT